VLGGALGVIGGVVLQPAVAILPLALAVGARSWRVRIALLALAAAFLAPVVRGDGGLVEAGAVVAAQLAVMTILVRLFGAHSGIAWVFAALVGALCGALRSAHAAGNGTDTLSALLGAATAVAVMAVVYRVADRTAAERSAADVA
jgi:hypothetical protein